MKETIRALISAAVKAAFREGRLPTADLPVFEVEEPRIKAHGDFATNFAMTGAAVYKMAPRAIAENVIPYLDDKKSFIAGTEILKRPAILRRLSPLLIR